MNETLRNEIASWLFDRVRQGRHEECGSMDNGTFGGTEVCIMKDESGYPVWLGRYAMPDFTIPQETSEVLIRSALDLCYDM